MLIVRNDTLVEPLNHIQGLDVNQEVKGAYTASFTSFNYPNNPGYALLEEESILIVDGQEFRVKQFEENRQSKRIVAVHTFYGLAGQRQDEIYGGTRTFNEFASFVLKGTGWTFSSTVAGSRFIENFGEANIIVLINALCTVYECEYEIRPNKHVHFAPQIGPDNDAQYRYGHNVKALSKKVDTTNLKTYIEGYGADGLFVSYTSPLASNPKIGIRKADPIRDDRFTQSDSLLEYIKRELNDDIAAYFELDSVELTNKELGERVWLIYEPLSVEFQTRILKQTKSIRNGKLVTSKVILGNILPKSTTDILVSQKVEIDENKKEYRSKFTQTNELIHMSVEAINESIATIELKADAIDISVNNRITNEVAAINVKASEIALKVTNLDSRMQGAESSINIQAGQISSKVEQRDYNGNTIASLITQSATAINLISRNINLVGAVTVLSDITGNLGNITAGTITLDTEATVGNTLNVGRLYDSGSKKINFRSSLGSAGITFNPSTDELRLNALNQVTISAQITKFAQGSVDFSSVSVTGLNTTAKWG
ncbi:MAG: phage tail spike protein [Psychrobacillus sp.]